MQSYSPSADLFVAAADLRSRGVPFVMATVVRAVAPTSAKPGDKALLTDDGLLIGWIGGSCAEPIVRREALVALRDGECRLVLITPEDHANAEAADPGRSVHSMECYSGGTLEIYVEPFLALPRLLVFGNSPVARALCDLGRVMRYAVTAIDLGERPQMGADIDTVRSLQALPQIDSSRAFAVVSSHGVFDEESLERAVKLNLPYVGFVTSQKRRAQVFAALEAKGISADLLARVHAPAGLALGGQQPEEIALSVMAEIVATRHKKAIANVVFTPESALAEALLKVPNELVTLDSAAPKAAKSCCHGSKQAK